MDNVKRIPFYVRMAQMIKVRRSSPIDRGAKLWMYFGDFNVSKNLKHNPGKQNLYTTFFNVIMI